VKQIRAMLYASLLKAQPKVTLDELTPLLTVANIGPLNRHSPSVGGFDPGPGKKRRAGRRTGKRKPTE
jgi:hypothetical protein